MDNGREFRKASKARILDWLINSSGVVEHVIESGLANKEIIVSEGTHAAGLKRYRHRYGQLLRYTETILPVKSSLHGADTDGNTGRLFELYIKSSELGKPGPVTNENYDYYLNLYVMRK